MFRKIGCRFIAVTSRPHRGYIAVTCGLDLACFINFVFIVLWSHCGRIAVTSRSHRGPFCLEMFCPCVCLLRGVFACVRKMIACVDCWSNQFCDLFCCCILFCVLFGSHAWLPCSVFEMMSSAQICCTASTCSCVLSTCQLFSSVSPTAIRLHQAAGMTPLRRGLD